MKHRFESFALPTASAERNGQIDHLLDTEAIMDQLRTAGTTVERAIVARPGRSLVIAGAAGLVLGWMWKRI